jgi:hypothetical protein
MTVRRIRESDTGAHLSRTGILPRVLLFVIPTLKLQLERGLWLRWTTIPHHSKVVSLNGRSKRRRIGAFPLITENIQLQAYNFHET